jgi:PhnB protein
MTIYLNPYIGFITGYWQKLIDGGNVTLPLAKAIWGDTFGMCLDRFGIGWLVNISGPQA